MSKLFTLIFLLWGMQCLQAQELQLTNFGTGFTQPVDIVHAGDSRLFIVQQNGYIYILDSTGVRNPVPFLNVVNKISTGSERGLLGLAFHPNYSSNGYFYVNYTQVGGSTRISRFSVQSNNPSKADSLSEFPLITITQPYSNHNGGGIRFGPDGFLYIGMGDGGSGGDPQNYAQSTASRLGKMLRIDVNITSGSNAYGIPADNPFITGPHFPEVWSVGHRNPWRFSFDPFTGDMWMGDVGQDNIEEINFEPNATSGRNYGWRCYEGNANYNLNGCQPASNYTFPVFQYTHASSGGCSVTGGLVYRGAQFGALFGNYYFADYCSGTIYKVVKNGNQFTGSSIQNSVSFQITTFGTDNKGEMYMAGRGNGIIYKLNGINCRPTAHIYNTADTLYKCENIALQLKALTGSGLSYQWQINGTDISNANTDSLLLQNPGLYQLKVSKAGCGTISRDSVWVINDPTVVSFNIGIDSLALQSGAVQLNAQPTGGTFSGAGVTGTSFNPAVAGLGQHIITYIFTTSNNCLKEVRDTIVIFNTTGLNEIIANQIEIFPNPTKDFLKISAKTGQIHVNTISIIDYNGKTIKKQLINSELKNLIIDLAGISSGIYFVEIYTHSGVVRKRVVVSK